MHLQQNGFYPLPQLLGENHRQAPPGLPVKQAATRNGADQHLLQTHGLRTELQLVRIPRLGFTPLVLHRHRLPKTLLPVKRNSGIVQIKFHHIASTGDSQRSGKDPHPPNDQQIAPAFGGLRIVGALMKQVSVHRAQIFLPQSLQMDQRPLPPAEGKVLNAREHEPVVFRIFHHSMHMQATPAGSAASSKETS
ncbi:hypothetical protein SDC9_111164 [bioreactor metagenome]|uniref:Uncharacterized protein n=1 Tax=bioreactor metagenome TaxID=1076179 RepID=A0A645BGQ0_9ZZZZ